MKRILFCLLTLTFVLSSCAAARGKDLAPETKTISIVPRTTPLEGESVEYEKNGYEVYYTYLAYTDQVSVPIMNAPEDDQITVKLACVRSAEEYNSVISDNLTENSLKDKRKYLEKRYDEEFFQNNSLIFVFYGAMVYDEDIITIIKNENELCICTHSSNSMRQEMKRLEEMRNDPSKGQLAVVLGHWFRLIEVEDDLSDIDTISYYIEAID